VLHALHSEGHQDSMGICLYLVLAERLNRGLLALVLASRRQIIFLLPGLLVLPTVFGWTGHRDAFPVAGALSIILTLIWTGIEFRRLGIRFRLRYS
jgi:hypothetical protein